MGKSKLNLAGVKLVNFGAKGIKVKYDKGAARGTYVFNDEYDVKHKSPIPLGLRDKFRALGSHVADLCLIGEQYVDHIDVTGVQSNGGDQFLITASVKTVDDKHFTVNTPKITEDTEYERFDEVIGVINEIYDGVIEYIESDRLVNDSQIIADFIASQKGESDIDLDSMSEDDQKDKAREILEKGGAIVMDADDYTVEEGSHENGSVEKEENVSIENPVSETADDSESTSVAKEVKMETEVVEAPKDGTWE